MYINFNDIIKNMCPFPSFLLEIFTYTQLIEMQGRGNHGVVVIFYKSKEDNPQKLCYHNPNGEDTEKLTYDMN